MARRGGYERVPGAEGADDAAARRVARDAKAARAARAQRTRAELIEAICAKVHAALWVAGAIVVAVYTDFFGVVWESDKVNRFWFTLGLMGCGVNIVLMLYLAVWLPYVARVTLEWNVYCPNVIPTMTAVGAAIGLVFTFALWPVWGILTIPILAVLFTGAFMSLMFIPSCSCGGGGGEGGGDGSRRRR